MGGSCSILHQLVLLRFDLKLFASTCWVTSNNFSLLDTPVTVAVGFYNVQDQSHYSTFSINEMGGSLFAVLSPR